MFYIYIFVKLYKYIYIYIICLILIIDNDDISWYFMEIQWDIPNPLSAGISPISTRGWVDNPTFDCFFMVF